MFGREDIEKVFDHLKKEYGTLSDWEQFVRDAHLGIARSDAGAALGEIDKRVVEVIERYKPSS